MANIVGGNDNMANQIVFQNKFWHPVLAFSLRK